MSKDWGNLPDTVQCYQQRFTALAMQRSVGVFKLRVLTAVTLTMAPPPHPPLAGYPALGVSTARPLHPLLTVSGSSGQFYHHEEAAMPSHRKVLLYFRLGCLHSRSGDTRLCADPNQTRFPWTIHPGHVHGLQPTGTNTWGTTARAQPAPLPCRESWCAPWDTFPLD